MIRLSTFLILTFALLLSGCMQPYRGVEGTAFENLDYPFTVKKVTVLDGIEVAYADEGSGGTPLIFIHGLGSYLPAWLHAVNGLKDDYRCIAIDLPGYGKSDKGAYGYDMTFFSDAVVGVMDGLGLEEAVLVGHSMGGQIAMSVALRYPGRVERLVLAAPAGLEPFTEGEKQWFREVMTVDGVKLTPPQQIRANLTGNFYNMPESAEFMVTDRIAMRGAPDFEWYCYAVVRSVHGMVDEPVYEVLERITQPTLIVFGEHDNLIPNPYLHGGRSAEIGRIGLTRIPNSTLTMVEDAGHFVMFEKAGEFNTAVRSFLSQD